MSFLSAIRAWHWIFLLLWVALVAYQPQPQVLLQEYLGFSLLGILGALFANSTGAGGGVVFMPFFNQLEFSVMTSVATSFAIQCCGMTAGALTWWAYQQKLKIHQAELAGQWQALVKVLIIVVPSACVGLWAVQYSANFLEQLTDTTGLHTGFGVFSMLLSVAIIFTIYALANTPIKSQASVGDLICLGLLALVGGAITAWLSIGVGELIAVYLIMRGFNVTFSIALAVMLSAFVVWAGVIFHVLVSQAIYWPVVLFAGLGAVFGGILAKQLVLYFSAKRLKLFFAGWIFILGLSALPF
ncbi:sulfite exporter TauE/SafE family protein [Paraglaciecola aestuariivivens]